MKLNRHEFITSDVVTVTCQDCGWESLNSSSYSASGIAARHAAKEGHEVTVYYEVIITFSPIEQEA